MNSTPVKNRKKFKKYYEGGLKKRTDFKINSDLSMIEYKALFF